MQNSKQGGDQRVRCPLHGCLRAAGLRARCLLSRPRLGRFMGSGGLVPTSIPSSLLCASTLAFCLPTWVTGKDLSHTRRPSGVFLSPPR